MKRLFCTLSDDYTCSYKNFKKILLRRRGSNKFHSYKNSTLIYSIFSETIERCESKIGSGECLFLTTDTDYHTGIQKTMKFHSSLIDVNIHISLM